MFLQEAQTLLAGDTQETPAFLLIFTYNDSLEQWNKML